jgi:nicotinate-nucleotide adenylyltransferase
VELGLDAVVLMPVGEAPHKEVKDDPGPDVRATLCELAVQGDARFSVSRAEVGRPGPSYTVDTLRRLASPGTQITLVLGADQASSLPSWREPEAVLSLARVAVAGREGMAREVVLSSLEGLAGADRIAFFEMPRVDISSSLVRERAASGRPIRYLVPRKVADHVQARGLYGCSTAVSAR